MIYSCTRPIAGIGGIKVGHESPTLASGGVCQFHFRFADHKVALKRRPVLRTAIYGDSSLLFRADPGLDLSRCVWFLVELESSNARGRHWWIYALPHRHADTLTTLTTHKYTHARTQCLRNSDAHSGSNVIYDSMDLWGALRAIPMTKWINGISA